MGKKMAPVLAVMAMLSPAASYALGLGNVVMHSALNEPLNAEIGLLSVQKGDLKDLKVTLGTAEDFARVNVSRELYYSEIKFQITKKPDGTPYVKLTTTQPITEPFMDFIVDAHWSRGRILREFTVLVDPPATTAEKPAPIQQATTTSAAPAQTMAPAATTAPQTMQPSQPAPIPERAELKPVLNRNGQLSYGPVKYKDTLYAIADEMRPNGVTTNQMMLALVRDNPQAFYHGNINELKAGYVLRIKNKNDLTALSVSKADQEVETQLAQWEARKSGKLVAQTGEAPAGGQVTRGEAPAKSATKAGQAQVKLVAPGSEGAGSGAGTEKDQIKSLRKDLLLAAEAMDANKQETDELKARLADMEDQLASMQKLIMLKDDEMLALQKQVSKGKGQVAEQATPEVAGTTTKEMAPVAGTTPPAPEAAAPAAEVKKPEKPAKPKHAKPAKKVHKEEPGFLSGILPDFLTQNPMVLYGGIGVIVLLVVVAVIRRRKGGGFEESILNVGEGGSTADMGATAESMEGNSESTMVSDFAMSEMSGLSGMASDASEVDPVSEADVYLAYGRHQQAEDILKEALAKEPDRHEVKLKLLEVYFAAKNKDAFEQGAQELHDAIGDESDPIWARVVTMGSQLCPDLALFGGAASASEAPQEEMANDVANTDEDLLDFDFDFEGDAGAEKSTTDSAVDDVFAELESATETTESVETAEEPAAEVEESSVDTGLDFDLDMGTPETETAAVEETEEKADDNSLDFDVSSLDFNLDTEESNEAPAEAATEVTATEASSDLDFDLGETATETAANSDLDSDIDSLLGDDLEGLSDDAFGEVDEVGTKLDLAKAYVDMGDSDGARSILDEVMEEGDDSQKEQAQQLLAQIG